jgi:hypothetical protein
MVAVLKLAPISMNFPTKLIMQNRFNFSRSLGWITQ